MQRKRQIIILVSLCLFIGIGTWLFIERSSPDPEDVVEDIASEYDLFSKSIGEDGSGHFIMINLKNSEDIPEVEQYLEEHLSKKDLEKYSIEVTSMPNVEDF